MHDHVKREEVFDGHARIGLNLGVRTYFSTEETAASGLGKRHRTGSPGSQVPTCQAEGCKTDLSTSKQYHRRHKVCELHSKAPNVQVGGQTQRFCQQCSRFHSLEEFDNGKRSCRKRLADHNRRRRKPQPYASVSAGKLAEPIGIKNEDDPSGSNRVNDSKSMIIPLKCRSSPSSVSLEDSDEKPGPVGNSLHFLSCNQGIRRGPGDDQHLSHSGMQMSSQDMKRSEALLSSLSPAPLMLQNAKQQMPLVGGNDNHDQDHSVYQQHLQAISMGQTSGPKLSLSSLGGQLGLSHQAGGRRQTISGQMHNEIETPVPWLRPPNLRSDLTQVIGRQSTMNLQHLMSNDSKSGIISTSANSQEPDVQAFPSSSQNLIPRDIASPEWMLGNMTGQAVRAGSNPFVSSSLNNITGNGQLESVHQIMPLIDSSSEDGRIPSNGGSDQISHRTHTPVEFMREHNTGTDSEPRGDDNNSRSGGSAVGSPDIKYHELHALRPYESVSSSIYDSNHNLL
nr:squamosa promoter binding protein 4 [Physcomitrium patens]